MGTTAGVKIRTRIWERDLGFPSPDTGPGTASRDRHWACCLSVHQVEQKSRQDMSQLQNCCGCLFP